MGSVGQNQARRYVLKIFAKWKYQLVIKITTVVKFIRMRHWGKVCYLRFLCLSEYDCFDVGKVGDIADNGVSILRVSAAVNALFVIYYYYTTTVLRPPELCPGLPA